MGCQQAPEKWFRDEKLIFAVSVIIGLSLSLCSLIFIHDLYRDSASVYAYATREIANGNFSEGWQTQVPMLNILLSAALCFCGVEAFRATVIVSCLFYLLTLFPLRRFLEEFVTPIRAAWGCLLFVTAPKLIRYSVSGLIDSSRYFFLIAALLLLFRIRKKTNYRDALLFGLSLAGLSVSRGEELVFAAGLLLALPLLTLLKKPRPPRSELKPRLAALLLSGVVFLIGITPFCAVNAHYSGVFITDVRIAQAVCPPPPPKSPPARTISEVPAGGTMEVPAPPATRNRMSELVSETFRGGYELYSVFALLGVLLVLIKREWSWEYTLFTGLYLAHSVIYFETCSAYRYFIYLIPLFMPLTMTGVFFFIEAAEWLKLPEKLPERLKHPAAWAAAAALLVLFAVQIENGLVCVTDRKDVWSRELAAVIRQWGQTHVPGRRLRIAATGLPEAVYWSGAYPVFGYKRGIGSLKRARNFDLLLINESQLPEIAGRTDLEPVPVPPRKKVEKKPQKRYLLFRLKGAPETGPK